MPPSPCDRNGSPKPADRKAANHDEPPTWPPVMLRLVMAAQPAALSLIRDRLRAWLRAHRWPEAELVDLVLAVDEAASNVVDHAYLTTGPGNIEIDAHITTVSDSDRVAELTICDRGRWRPKPQQPNNRQRGIAMMSAAVALLTIHNTDQGTSVRMRSRSVNR
jgi:anti-sigma regulatory factor (Ser/Thr protein kinase)